MERTLPGTRINYAWIVYHQEFMARESARSGHYPVKVEIEGFESPTGRQFMFRDAAGVAIWPSTK